ncbi:MAG: 2-C-methyl-D-erythritol 4-phosphate cytidylyltransferase [Longimicrobiales bacterium]|nr:2-C-methyl-D-erythritol 4-phosphate cytidylyltransferase [Longimicrobiales bacterium]
MASPNAPRKRVGAVIVAAGESRRMGGVDKIFTPLLGVPLILHPLRVFNDSPLVDEIALVVAPARVEEARRLVSERGLSKVRAVRGGGTRRQDSVRVGLEALSRCDWVLVHDGARCCVSPSLIEAGLEAARESGAAIAAVPVVDTVKVVADQQVQSTLDRNSLWAVQTPQVFRTELLLDAHRRCPELVTDDAAMVERLGVPVRVFMGAYDNLKVTTPEDLLLAEAILRARAGQGR